MFKFGIMGAGTIASRFCKAIKNTDCAEVCAVSSKSEKRAEKFAAENGVQKYYGSYEKMLEDAGADAVYIATTNNFHYENILLCLEHGMPVLCEKPLVMTAKQAREVFEKAEKNKVFVMEAMWPHLLPGNIKAKELIAQGAIGDVVSADYNFGFYAGSGSRVLDKKIGGGALYDVGVYGIEGLMYLIGRDIDEVIPAISYNADGIDTADHVVLRMGDCLAHVHSSISANLKNDAYIYGTEGRIYMEQAYGCRKFTLTKNDGTESVYTFDFGDGFEFEIEEAVKCIKNGELESSYVPHSETVRCAEIFDMCLKK